MRKILVIFVVAIMLVGCGRNNIDYTEEYKKLEDELLSAAKHFVEVNDGKYISLTEEPYSIGLTNLYNGNYITKKLIDPKTKSECDKEKSYVHVKLEDGEPVYTVHLECGDYVTK